MHKNRLKSLNYVPIERRTTGHQVPAGPWVVFTAALSMQKSWLSSPENISRNNCKIKQYFATHVPLWHMRVPRCPAVSPVTTWSFALVKHPPPFFVWQLLRDRWGMPKVVLRLDCIFLKYHIISRRFISSKGTGNLVAELIRNICVVANIHCLFFLLALPLSFYVSDINPCRYSMLRKSSCYKCLLT